MADLFSFVYDPSTYPALFALIAMEVVLGIDNLLFISILAQRLPPEQQDRARLIGISLALVLRLVFLSLVVVIVQLTTPIVTLFGQGFSWRDIILIAGGLFLVWKATKEIHHSVDPIDGKDEIISKAATTTFGAVIVQILILDAVFSIDSIITAVGMTDEIGIMITAVVVTVAVMLIAANPLARFIQSNPTLVMLALGFLLMIGMTLIAEGFGAYVPKGYIYAAMAFSIFIEGLNMLARRKKKRDAELRAAYDKAATTPVEGKAAEPRV